MRDARSPETGPSPGERRPGLLGVRRLVPVCILVAGLIAFFALDLHRFVTLDALKTHRDELQAWVAAHGALSWLVFVGLYAVAVALSVPGGAIMTIAGGFLFGPYVATALVVLGATTGATVLFLAARHAFADYFRARAGGALKRMEDGFNANPLSYLLALRLVPIFPFWLVNLVPALLGVRLDVFVIGTLIGIIPGTFVYALVGDGAGAVLDAGKDLDLGIIFEPRFLAPLVGLAALACLPILYRRLRARRRRAG